MSTLRRPAGIAVGSWVRFRGQVRGVVAVATKTVTLTDSGGDPQVVTVAGLLAEADFTVVDSPVRMPLPAASLLETFPPQVVERALWWEGTSSKCCMACPRMRVRTRCRGPSTARTAP